MVNMVKIGKKTEEEIKRSNTVKNGQKWSIMVTNGNKKYLNGQKRSRLSKTGLK